MSKSKRWMILTGSVSGLLALLAVLFAVNFMLVPVRARLDMTEGKLYTLSAGSRNIMAKLAYPVTLKLFFNGSSPDMPAPIKTFARQVEDLVREYAAASNGKIIVEKYDPAPDSDAEEWAQRYGLSRQELGMGLGGPGIVLGLVAECGSVQACIPFFDPRADDLLEYNISRLIYRVSNPKKPVVGVLSSLPVTGAKAIPMMMQRMPSKPAWVAFQELGEDNDIRDVASDADTIAPDLDLLIVVHPKNLTDKTLYAIDQFVLRGGRLLAFVDPMSLVDRMAGNPEQMPGMPRYNSELNKLLRAWGLSFDPMKLVADLEAATAIRTSETEADESPLFLSLKDQNVNSRDILTSRLGNLVLPFAGTFTGNAAEGLTLIPLLISSEQSQQVDAMMASMPSAALRRNFRSESRYNLAVRVEGKFKTAFPGGKPKPEPADPNAAPPKEEPSEAGESLKESAKPSMVILVGDVDMLNDQFAVREMSFLNFKTYQPANDNLSFFVAAVEQLSGSPDFAQIRTRGRLERPFTRVQELLRKAQSQYMNKEKELQDELDRVNRELETLQAQKDKSQRLIWSPEQKRKIEDFKEKRRLADKELKKVRKSLREDIESLGVIVKALNILLVPILVCAGGLGFATYRRSKTRSSAAV